MQLSAELDIGMIAPALASLGVATIHEAQGRRGLLNGLNLMVGPAFAGMAATVSIPAGDNLGIHAAIREAPRDSVVCIASAGLGIFGVLGDILQAAARARGIAGMVIDDGIRDLAQLEAPPSICAKAVGARGTQKRRVLSINGAVALGGVLVRPGDWVVGDRDGVCVVPVDQISDLLAAARGRAAKENGIRTELARGRSTVDVLGLAGLLDKDSHL